MRCFIALRLSEDLRHSLGELIKLLKPLSTSLKWVPQENLHLTIKFLGNIDESALPDIERAMTSVCSSHKVIELEASGLKIFPDRRMPRVIWAGLRETGGGVLLPELHGSIESAMKPLGFAFDGRGFNPHLTLGRVKRRRGKKPPDIEPLINEINTHETEVFGRFRADEVALFKSDLLPTGAIYTTLLKIPFG